MANLEANAPGAGGAPAAPVRGLQKTGAVGSKQALVGAILLMTLLTAFCVTRPFKL